MEQPTLNHPETWLDVVAMLIASIPAIVAAISSLRNHRTLKSREKKYGPMIEKIANGGNQTANKKPRPADWYQPPEF